MNDEDKTKEQLVGEVVELRQRNAELRAAKAERDRTEEDLRESLQTTKDIIETIPSGLFIYQYEAPNRLILVDGNPSAERSTGIHVKEWLGREFNEIWPSAHDTGITEAFLNVMRTGETFETEDLYYKDERLEGAFLMRVFRMPRQRLGVAFENITERKRAEEALRESEERYRELADLLPQTVFELDAKANVTYSNRYGFESTGYTEEDIDNGLNALQLFIPEDHQRIRQNISRIMSGKELKAHEYTMLRKDGSTYPVLVYTRPIIHDERPVGLRGIVVDITEHKRAEEELKRTQAQLVQSEKIASLGMLLAGVAHEINTPVGAISSMHSTLVRAIERLKSTLDATGAIPEGDQKCNRIFKVIEDANQVIASGTERVMNIVRRLRSFARPDETELKRVDIHQGIEDTLAIAHHELKHKATVERNFGDVPPIACYPSRLNQVYLNLLINAVQAMEDRGTITITTFQRDNHVYIRIKDTGIGIPEEALSRIFDPSYTTKSDGVGTGLGLSICYQIVRDHHGEILVESEVGKGTTFTVMLPMNLDEILEEI